MSGRLAAIVDDACAEQILAVMQAHRLGSRARRIGPVSKGIGPHGLLRTAFGPTRILDLLTGEQLSRIC